MDAKRSDREFFAHLQTLGIKPTAAELKLPRSIYGRVSEDAPEVHEKPLKLDSPYVPNTDLNDTEKIAMAEDIDEYFAREVLPFAPDAWMDRSKDKVGCEFPFTRIFYKYRPLRSASEILAELRALDALEQSSSLNN